jgi:hypothetical protein
MKLRGKNDDARGGLSRSPARSTRTCLWNFSILGKVPSIITRPYIELNHHPQGQRGMT